jgi:coatomer protein complex subunit gamma
LLQTGAESSVERLLKTVGNLMEDMSDEFKVVVIDAIRILIRRFPAKYRLLLTFLSACLRDEGGFEFKNAVVNSILAIMTSLPESKESALAHLCEFIEDSEFQSLTIRVMGVLADEAATSPHASRYVRYVYNRLILEVRTYRVLLPF